MSHSDLIFMKWWGNSLYALSKTELNMDNTINALPFTSTIAILRKAAEIVYVHLILK